MDDDPGPPFSQTVSGAVVGSWLRASKNHLTTVSFDLLSQKYHPIPEDMLILCDVGVARVALDIGIELTNAGWHLLVAHVDTGSSLLEREVLWRRNKLRQSRREQSRGRQGSLDHGEGRHRNSRRQQQGGGPVAHTRPRLWPAMSVYMSGTVVARRIGRQVPMATGGSGVRSRTRPPR